MNTVPDNSPPATEAPPVPPELQRLARRLFWWKSPAEALADPRRFLTQVMTLGTWDDVQVARRYWTEADFHAVLRDPPRGCLTRAVGATGTACSASSRCRPCPVVVCRESVCPTAGHFAPGATAALARSGGGARPFGVVREARRWP